MYFQEWFVIFEMSHPIEVLSYNNVILICNIIILKYEYFMNKYISSLILDCLEFLHIYALINLFLKKEKL